MRELHHLVHGSFFFAVNKPVFSGTVFGMVIALLNFHKTIVISWR